VKEVDAGPSGWVSNFTFGPMSTKPN
jgi:hypothetical protein